MRKAKSHASFEWADTIDTVEGNVKKRGGEKIWQE